MPEKVSKKAANYRRATGFQKCTNCSHFRSRGGSTGTCTVVTGRVGGGMTSDLWNRSRRS